MVGALRLRMCWSDNKVHKGVKTHFMFSSTTPMQSSCCIRHSKSVKCMSMTMQLFTTELHGYAIIGEIEEAAWCSPGMRAFVL